MGTVHDCLRIAAGVVATMTPNAEKLRAQLVPEMLATDLADYLVRKVSAFIRQGGRLNVDAFLVAESMI